MCDFLNLSGLPGFLNHLGVSWVVLLTVTICCFGIRHGHVLSYQTLNFGTRLAISSVSLRASLQRGLAFSSVVKFGFEVTSNFHLFLK